MARRVRRSRADNRRWDQMVAILRLMNFAFNNVRLYPPAHSEVVGVLDKLIEGLKSIFEEQEDLGYGFMDELLYIEGAMSIEETASNQMLVDRFSRCRVKYLTLMKGVSREDLLVFFQILNAESTKPTEKTPGDQLGERGVQTIHIVEADVDDLASKSKLGRKRTLLDWYEKAVGHLGEARDAVLKGGLPDPKPLFRLADDLTATVRSKGHEPYLLLPDLGSGLDPHLTHSINVAVLCCALGDQHKLNSGQIQTLCLMALLHDLGRLTIPIEWCSDHTPLAPEERDVARRHAEWGFLLLLRCEGVTPQTALMAARHHDRAGARAEAGAYHPDTLHRLLRAADAYDLALAGERYYWRKRRRDRVLKKLLNRRGAELEPHVVKLLANAVGLYPAGSHVQLDDGQLGVVVRPNHGHPTRPRVFLYRAPSPPPPPVPEGMTPPPPLAPGEELPPAILDLDALGEGGLGFARSIARVLEPTEESRAAVERKKEYLLSFSL